VNRPLSEEENPKRREPLAGGSHQGTTKFNWQLKDTREPRDPQGDRRFGVFCEKFDSHKILFAKYASASEAKAVCQALLRVGCRATVEVLA
jgi:hypothetical protein